MPLIALAKIRTDGGTQPRAAIDMETVDDYGDAMREGIKFPPVTVFYDGSDYWLADGFHRRNAAFAEGFAEINCEVHQGTREDAQWFSFSANKTNGLRRSNEDKQRAVKAALAHPAGAGKSDHQIARHVGVDVKTVGAWREKLSMEIPQIVNRTVTRGASTYQQNTANIGRKPDPAKANAKDLFERGRRMILEAPSVAAPVAAPPPRPEPPPPAPDPDWDHAAEAITRRWREFPRHADTEPVDPPSPPPPVPIGPSDAERLSQARASLRVGVDELMDLADRLAGGGQLKAAAIILESTDEFVRSVIAKSGRAAAIA